MIRITRRYKGLFSAIGLTLLTASPGFSQSPNWYYAVSIYLFTAETDVEAGTPFGPVEGNFSFSDALDNLDFAFMGAFEASNGLLSFGADYMLNDLSFENSTPGPALSGLETDFKTQIFTAYAAYRVYDTSTSQVDLAAGFRWFDAESTFTLTPGNNPGGSSKIEDDWFDPIVGARARFQLSDRWAGTVFADYGGFSSDSETWQALLADNYALMKTGNCGSATGTSPLITTSMGTIFPLTNQGPFLAQPIVSNRILKEHPPQTGELLCSQKATPHRVL